MKVQVENMMRYMVRIIVVTSLCQKLSHLVLPVDVAGLTVVLAAERPLARPLARLRDGWCVCVCVRVMIREPKQSSSQPI